MALGRPRYDIPNPPRDPGVTRTGQRVLSSLGDPFGYERPTDPKDSPDPKTVAKIHERSDVDSKAEAQHHTLGMGHDQASQGDHRHNGKDSKRLMEGITITGSKGGNVALGNLITALSSALGFTDSTT